MKKIFLLLIATLLFSSCEREAKTEKIIWRLSKSMNDFIEVLKKDNYNIKIKKQDKLIFETYNKKLLAEKVISFPKLN